MAEVIEALRKIDEGATHAVLLRELAGAKAVSPRGFEKVLGLHRIVYDSHDYHEGIRAFKKNRRPVFTGK